MEFNPQKEQIVKEYYSTLEKLLCELAKSDYRKQELVLKFPVGNIKLTVYGATCNEDI